MPIGWIAHAELTLMVEGIVQPYHQIQHYDATILQGGFRRWTRTKYSPLRSHRPRSLLTYFPADAHYPARHIPRVHSYPLAMLRVLSTMTAFTVALSAFTHVDARNPRTPRPCAGLIDVHADTTTLADAPFAKAQLRPVGGRGPRYPVHLRNAREPGDVVATYVVDTLGHVMRNTAQITSESDRAFGASVCTFLATARFLPVTIDGRKLTMRVIDQHFKFRVD